MRADEPSAEQGFPRTYRVDSCTRRVVNGFLLVLAGVFLFLALRDVAGLGPRSGHPGNAISLALGFAALLAWMGSSYNKRVILHQDSIEVKGWFYSRKLSFVDIRGRQTTGSSRLAFGYAYIFAPSDPRKRNLALPPFLHTDQFFRDWIKTIPKIRR